MASPIEIVDPVFEDDEMPPLVPMTDADLFFFYWYDFFFAREM
jgi:hypothetical protein